MEGEEPEERERWYVTRGRGAWDEVCLWSGPVDRREHGNNVTFLARLRTVRLMRFMPDSDYAVTLRQADPEFWDLPEDTLRCIRPWRPELVIG